MSIGAIIAKLAKRKGELKRAQDKVKGIEDEIDKVKLELRAELDKVGLTEGRNDTHSATIVEKVVPQVVDWDKFYAFIYDNKFFHLLQRRPSTTGCEELFAQGDIPGVERFKKVDVSLRSI
jgi:hypothetical protein